MSNEVTTSDERLRAIEIAQTILRYATTGYGVTEKLPDGRDAWLLAATLMHATRLIGRMTSDESRLTEQLEDARREIASLKDDAAEMDAEAMEMGR